MQHDDQGCAQEEALRIEAAGGVVFDKCVMGVLTVSRALGHQPLKVGERADQLNPAKECRSSVLVLVLRHWSLGRRQCRALH